MVLAFGSVEQTFNCDNSKLYIPKDFLLVCFLHFPTTNFGNVFVLNVDSRGSKRF